MKIINSDSHIYVTESTNIYSDSYIQVSESSIINSNSHIYTTETSNINSNSYIQVSESTNIFSNSHIKTTKSSIKNSHIHLTTEDRAEHLTNRCLVTDVREKGFYLKGWRDECNVDVDAIILDNNHSIEMFHNEDSLEIDFILSQKPSRNVFFFNINSKNLNFFYQPIQEEIDEGCNRPENVIGSYAVYHKTKQDNYKYSDGTEINYETGKFCHIYRPYAEDFTGKRVWCKLKKLFNKLAVKVPQEFLDNAIYPVRIDPVFGTTKIGASSGGGTTGTQWASKKTMTSDIGTVARSISAWSNAGTTSSDSKFDVAFYSNDSANNKPSALQDNSTTSAVFNSTYPKWFTADLPDSVVLSANTVYWLCQVGWNHIDAELVFYYDVGGETRLHFKTSAGNYWIIHGEMRRRYMVRKE